MIRQSRIHWLYAFLPKCLLGLVILLASVASSAQAAGNDPVILVLGDSLSAAEGTRVEEGWVNLLRIRLTQSGYRYTIVNASITGLPTPGGLRRLPALLSEHKPAILVIELGANDGLRGFPPATITQNLTAMGKLGLEAGAQILIIAVPIPLNYGPDYRTQYEATFTEAGRNLKVPVAPSLLGNVPLNPNLMQADGLHPNAAAQPYLLDNVWPYLQPLLKK